MPSIDLSLISSSTKDRANGYIEEILKRGKIVGSYVELSDSDYNYIKNNFKAHCQTDFQSVFFSKKTTHISLNLKLSQKNCHVD